MEHHTRIKLYMWDFCQCDPKRCSGRKLVRQKLVKTLPINASFHGICLTPDSSASLLTPADAEIIARNGVAVIDCSWNEYSAGRGVNEVKRLKYRNGRFLPFLMAGNPVNFGRPFKLNCAEALAGALAICGFMKDAQSIMEVFGWGETFLDINKKVIKEYTQCKTLEDVLNVQKAYTETDENIKEKREQERAKMFDIPDSDEEEYFNPNRMPIEEEESSEEEEESSEEEEED
ncbi:metalbinding family, in rnase L inhibitor RLI family protein, putative [Entamoeba histolytica KU27]|uniref:18S rRNA aminocarboxypropyltransferase n=1 Tax=Entamoeba histolytica KU27 TaxID=885311 RepID=M2R1J0_ENTHI|nr:metalbinding family, in rnase L inhibitor RLI family protein, putative [Entamoeba histolytica KU27]